MSHTENAIIRSTCPPSGFEDVCCHSLRNQFCRTKSHLPMPGHNSTHGHNSTSTHGDQDDDHGHDEHGNHDSHTHAESHAAIGYMFTPETRLILAIFVSASVFAVAIAQIWWSSSLLRRKKAGVVRQNVDRFHWETIIFCLVSMLCVIPLSINASIADGEMCGVVSMAVYPFYIVCKYSFYRILYSKAILLNVMKQYPLFTKICYYMTHYVSVPVLVGFMIGDLVLLRPDLIEIPGGDFCIAHCKFSHGSEHLVVTLTTTSVVDIFINITTVVLLALPVIGTEYLKFTATISFVGAFLTASSTAVILITRIYTASSAGYILLRFSSDMLLMDWWFNFLIGLMTFHAVTLFYRIKSHTSNNKNKKTVQQTSQDNNSTKRTGQRSTRVNGAGTNSTKASCGIQQKHSRKISGGIVDGTHIPGSDNKNRMDNPSVTVLDNVPKARNDIQFSGGSPRSNSATPSAALTLKPMNSGLYSIDSTAEHDSPDSKKLLKSKDDRDRVASL
ncbi:hypothetical protein AAMO2058_001146500 [Amorphochlora amoebiformis]